MRKLSHCFCYLFLLVMLNACVSGPMAPPAQVQLDRDRGAVDITWSSIPRPAPLPPLDHAALLLPIRLAGHPEKVFYMQFDLGHPSTTVYSNKWQDIAAKYQIPTSIDKVPSLTFSLGDMQASVRHLAIMQREGQGIDWEGERIELIGTIGADLIDGRVVVMDFVQDKILFARDRQGLHRDGTSFQAFSFSGRRIVMTVMFEGEQKRIMYDSGSSAFSWLSNEKTAKRLARANVSPTSYPIRSWDKILTAHTSPTDATVQVGGLNLPLREISYIQDMGLLQEAAISSMGVGGMVGNKLFLGRKLIIDTRKLEIAVEE